MIPQGGVVPFEFRHIMLPRIQPASANPAGNKWLRIDRFPNRATLPAKYPLANVPGAARTAVCVRDDLR